MQSFFSSVGSGGSSLISTLTGRLKTTLNNGHDTKQAKEPKAAEVKSPVAIARVSFASVAIASTIPVKQSGKGITNTMLRSDDNGDLYAGRGGTFYLV